MRLLGVITPSPRPPLRKVQRLLSYAVWSVWILMFLFWELSGDLRWTPWKTFSETVWDMEQHHPGTKRRVLAFALALSEHLHDRTELRSAYAWALRNVDGFEQWMDERGAP